jgi:hypothetical protein
VGAITSCYFELANECLMRADRANNEATREDFNRQADAYFDIARAELESAERQAHMRNQAQ